MISESLFALRQHRLKSGARRVACLMTLIFTTSNTTQTHQDGHDGDCDSRIVSGDCEMQR